MFKHAFWLRLSGWLQLLRKYAVLLFFAWRHPETPRHLKTILAVGALYCISPIDLVPDTIPFVGLLDDFAVLPALMMLLGAALPPRVMQECEQDAARWRSRIPYISGFFFLLLFLWAGALLYGIWSWLR